MPPWRICDVDWPLDERLRHERDTLGFFLSGHPLDPWQAEFKQLGLCPLSGLEKTWQERKDRRGEAPVVVADAREIEAFALDPVVKAEGGVRLLLAGSVFGGSGAAGARSRCGSSAPCAPTRLRKAGSSRKRLQTIRG